MAKTLATVMGVAFVLVGIAGFIAPTLLGMHLSPAHSVIHLVTGFVSLFFGLKATLGGARTFCIVFGLVYALLGVAGFALGGPSVPGVPGPEDSKLWKVIPGIFEVGSMDHIVHIVLGTVFLFGGFLTRQVGVRDGAATSR